MLLFILAVIKAAPTSGRQRRPDLRPGDRLEEVNVMLLQVEDDATAAASYCSTDGAAAAAHFIPVTLLHCSWTRC